MQSMFMALLLLEAMPAAIAVNWKPLLVTLAHRMGRNREIAGLHYESDTAGGIELAAKLGVKASHVAYLENGRRRPSLSLLRRLSTVMGLDSETIFLLAHPEAKELITPRDGMPAKRPENAWRNFLKDRSLIARHQIKPGELRVLKQVNLLGRVTSPRQFLFILNSIRQAVEEE